MVDDRIKSRDLIWITAALILGAVGLGTFLTKHDEAFPQAAIEFKVDKGESQRLGEKFLELRGYELKDYKFSTVFDLDYQGMTFIQKQLEPDEVNPFLSTQIDVWWWRTRWFQPLQKEEFQVYYSPKGYLLGFQHLIPEEQPGDELSVEDARSLVTSFLADLDGFNATQFEEIEHSFVKRPERLDHVFTYERRGFALATATHRVEITIQGTEVGGMKQFLKVPEQWQRDYATMRSNNYLLNSIATLLTLPLALAMLMIFLKRYKIRDLNWSPSIFLGLTMFILHFIMSLNNFPLELADYPTTQPYPSFVLRLIMQAFVGSVIQGFMVFLFAATGECMYRETSATKQRMDTFLTLRGWRTKESLLAPLIGYCFALLILGYVVIFYLMGRKIGVWVPLDIQYSDLISTYLPAIFPITISVSAALTEELLFRLFAVSLLRKYLHSNVIAVVVPALLWGFLHSAYPQEPSWIRGIEVGVMGIIAGMVYLRFGIVAALIWHYAVDCLLIGMFLFNSGSTYHVISGALSVGIFLILFGYSLVKYLRTKTLLTEPAWLNSSPLKPLITIEAPVKEPPLPVRLAYKRLSNRLRLLAVGLAVGGGILYGSFSVRIWGDWIRLHLSRSEIFTAADQHFEQTQAVGNYLKALNVSVTSPNSVGKYLREQLGTAKAYDAFAELSDGFYWLIRYFQPMEKEEWKILARTSGALYSKEHVIPEAAGGANPEREAAIARAEIYVTKQLGRELTGYRLIEAVKEQQPNRTDWSITWEQETPIAGKAYPRLQVVTAGLEPLRFKATIKLPEEWEREQAKTPPHRMIFKALEILLYSGGAVILLFSFFGALRGGSLSYRFGFTMAGLSLATGILGELLSLPSFLTYYPTTTPLRSFFVLYASSRIPGLVITALAVFLLGVAVDVLWTRTGSGGDWSNAGSRTGYFVDGLCSGLAVAAMIAGWNALWDHVIQVWNLRLVSLPELSLMFLADLLPGISSFCNNMLLVLFYLLMLMALRAVLVQKSFHRRYVLIGLGLLAVAVAGQQAESIQAFSALAAKYLGFAAIVTLGVVVLLRRNLAGYSLTVMTVTLAPVVSFLINQPGVEWRNQGVILAALIAGTFVVLAIRTPQSKLEISPK